MHRGKKMNLWTNRRECETELNFLNRGSNWKRFYSTFFLHLSTCSDAQKLYAFMTPKDSSVFKSHNAAGTSHPEPEKFRRSRYLNTSMYNVCSVSYVRHALTKFIIRYYSIITRSKVMSKWTARLICWNQTKLLSANTDNVLKAVFAQDTWGK
jgi:hypothetical protein